MSKNLKFDIASLKGNKKKSTIILFLKGIIMDNGFLAVVIYRIAHWLFRKNIPFIPSILQRVSTFLTGIDISFKSEIGAGLRIAHGVGIVIGSNVKIGKNALILHGVTIGERDFTTDAMPKIGDDVLIGAGAKVLGDIHVGNGAKIGANAVVIHSVPEGATVTGIPARVVSNKKKLRGEK